MAVLFDAASSANDGTGGSLSGAYSWTHTPVSSAPSGVVVCIGYYDGEFTLPSPTITYGGVSMVLNCTIQGPIGTTINHGSGPENGNYWTVSIYGLASPPSGAQTVSVTWGGALDVFTAAGAVTVTGSDLVNIFRATGVTSSGTSITPTITVSSQTGDLVIDAIASGGSWIGGNAGSLDGFSTTNLLATGLNLRSWIQSPLNFGTTNSESASTTPGAASVTTNWSKVGSSAAFWYMAAASIKAAAGSGSWVTIPISGGGYCDGLDIVSDGTMLLRSDTVPAPYLYNGTIWTPIGTSNNLPSTYVSPRSDHALGTWEARICPSLTTKFYMVFSGDVLVTTNSGQIWTVTAGWSHQTDMDANDGFRGYNHRMAVDPQNDTICFVGTPSNGLQRTLNSGTTWTQRTVGAGTGTSGAGMLIAFDPTSSVVSNAKQGLFVGRYGTGIYHSTDGGGTFTILNTTGMPTSFSNIICDQNGLLWVCIDSGASDNIWTWTSGGGWVQNVFSGTVNQSAHSISVDPNNANHVVFAAGGGAIAASSNGGTTFHDLHGDTTVNGDVYNAWQQTHQVGGSYFITDGQVAFDYSGNLWQAWGFGVMFAPNVFASTSAVTLTAVGRGVEGLDCTAICHPPGGNPIGASYDVPVWNFPEYITSPTHAATNYKPAFYYNGINPQAVGSSRGWAFDYDKSNTTNPSFVVAITGFMDNGSGTSGYSMFSNDAGATWSLFPSGTQSGTPFGSGGGYFGSVAVSTTSNFVVQNGNGLFFTTNGGTSFSASTYAGNNGTSTVIPGQYIAADPNNANNFLIISPVDGIYKSTNSGSTWSKISTFQAASVGFGQRIIGIPGQTNHFLLTGGWLDTGTPPQANGHLYRSTDGGVTWNALSNIGEVWCMDWGTTVAGQSYPTIYFVGWYNPGSGMTFGVWKTTDNFTTFTRLGGIPYPMGTYTVITGVAGDKNIDGACSISFFGGGFKRFSLDSGGGGGPVTPAFGFSVITDSGQRRTRMIGY
jgi:hypothetical protein